VDFSHNTLYSIDVKKRSKYILKNAEKVFKKRDKKINKTFVNVE